MSNAAIENTQFHTDSRPTLYLVYSEPSEAFWNRRRILVLTTLLVVLQVLDGILTYTGMHIFGISAEGNPLLRGLMNGVGILPAIAITKLVCIGVIGALCAQADRISWLPVALSCVAGVYAAAAVIPWSWLLLSEYYT